MKKNKIKAYTWDYRHPKDELYDSGGWILVDEEKGITFVAEIHECTLQEVYKENTIDKSNLRLELVKSKHFSLAKVEDMLKDVLKSKYLFMSDEIRKELEAYRK